MMLDFMITWASYAMQDRAFNDPAATCGSLASGGIPTDAYNLNYPSIGVAEVPGSQTVIRTVTSVADRRVNFEAKVDAPKGYQVTVNPKSWCSILAI